MIDTIINEFPKYFPEVNNILTAGIPIFARIAGLMRTAPFLQRSEIPNIAKIGFTLIFTVMLSMYLHPAPPAGGVSIIYSLVINYLCGALIGFIVNCIVKAIESGGDMINMQQGVSSATIMDPTTSSQVSIMGRIFSILGLIIFLEIGGAYWTFNALIRSFEVFPIYSVMIPIDEFVNMSYLIKITSNVLYIGLQIASPVLIATLGQDIILGIISKTAPQVNVFQMSFLFKPCMGSAILIVVMPSLLNIISDFYLSFSNIF
ncbi:MAG: flagellar biosynthetic protein FliR [Candidatus Gastranaerophilales bacterium]|nr:flagellar biosynthetic protein FliR [Candidatus Gastranaerophilales bacterium]